jgi:DNA-binding LacI/PurR family transcriptional regulator
MDGDFTEAGGFRAMTTLLRREVSIQVIFATNDEMVTDATNIHCSSH